MWVRITFEQMKAKKGFYGEVASERKLEQELNGKKIEVLTDRYSRSLSKRAKLKKSR